MMLTNMRDTSLDSFTEHKKKLNENEKAVLIFLKGLGTATNLEICKFSGLPINNVSGRMNGLVKKGKVIAFEKRLCKISGNKVIAWKAV